MAELVHLQNSVALMFLRRAPLKFCSSDGDVRSDEHDRVKRDLEMNELIHGRWNVGPLIEYRLSSLAV